MYYDTYDDLIKEKSKQYEEYLQQIKYLTIDDVENPKIKFEDLEKFHPSLNEDNYLTYLFFLVLRPDLTETEKTHYKKMSLIKRALEKRDYEKQYKHFDIANY
jgi:hypothetical protein